jgi:hypothetical protein
MRILFLILLLSSCASIDTENQSTSKNVFSANSIELAPLDDGPCIEEKKWVDQQTCYFTIPARNDQTLGDYKNKQQGYQHRACQTIQCKGVSNTTCANWSACLPSS